MIDNDNNDNCLNYTIQENDKSVKQILLENLNFSQRFAVKLEMSGRVLLNNQPIKIRKRCKEGDVLTVFFDDDKNDEYEAVEMPLDILYEDESILAVNKPPFMVVHPTRSHLNDTLANGVRYYFDSKHIKAKIRLVNRLDMNTSGIVLLAKNSFVHNEISKQMQNNEVDKYYVAICEGLLEQDKGTINAPIARLNEDDIIRVVDKSGKECITHYEVLKRLEDLTLVRLKLETGRTHQIRVHLKHIGHPIIGDTLYNKESDKIDRQALHCCEMSFTHPINKTRITIKADMPEDFKNIIEK